MRLPGAQGLRMSRRADVSRRDFPTGIFRGRNLALVGTGGVVWAHAVRGSIDDGDYLNCGRSLEVCPRDAFAFTWRFHRPMVEA